ncbi:MAG: ferrous iron transport protein A [Akkermansiaceae bacterium]|nr:ferrous iron transport protein A [Akkermansiaceae bacterium]NNM30518.1 ferrous iron transport protein A [Akkermansiaceae bacterium]
MAEALTAEPACDRNVTLSQAAIGCDLEVTDLEGPACRELREIGFCEQMRLRKLTNGRNLVCAVCGTRLALSRELAKQVRVAPVA